MNEDKYYYNNEPLQLSYRNTYTADQKIEIVLKLQQDYEAGMVSDAQMRWIVNNLKFGAWTVQNIIDKMMFNNKIKINPITLDNRTFKKKPTPFDL